MRSLKVNNGKHNRASNFSRESQNIALGRFAIIYFSMCSHLLNYQFAKNFWIKKVCRLLAHIDQRSPWAFIFIIIAFYFLWFWQNRVCGIFLWVGITREWVDLIVTRRDPQWGLGSGHHDANTRSIADGSVTMPGAGEYRRWPSGALSRQSLPNLHPDSFTLITLSHILYFRD